MEYVYRDLQPLCFDSGGLNFEGDVKSERHWILDHHVGRELLRTRLVASGAQDTAFLWQKELNDRLLDPVIDELALRGEPEPQTLWQDVCVSARFLWYMVRTCVMRY
jgi:hypothetical protein